MMQAKEADVEQIIREMVVEGQAQALISRKTATVDFLDSEE